MNQHNPRVARPAGIIETAAVVVAFYQALRVLFSVLFGAIYDALFAETAPMTGVGLILLAVVVALLAPLVNPRQPRAGRVTALLGSVLVFLARIPLTLNDPQARLAASIVIVAGAGLYLAARLRAAPRDAVHALLLALVADQFLRAMGHTWDVTLRQAWWPWQVTASALLCLLAGWLFRQRRSEGTTQAPGWGIRIGLAWGGWLFLQTSLLAFPNATARWSGGAYLLLAPFWPLITLAVWTKGDPWMTRRGWRDGLLLLILLPVGLSVGYLASGLLAVAGLALAQVASLILLSSSLLLPDPAPRERIGPALAVGGVLYLVLSFAYAFSFTYAYTLDLFRDLGLPVFLLAGLLTGLPALLLPSAGTPVSPPSRARLFAIGACGVGLVALILVVAFPRQQPQPAGGDSFRVATYNIHYGYDTVWHLSLEDQARAIEDSGASVVMMQEVDTGRPTSYMIDDALWLARRLGMREVYLPTMEHLTGIALLSRFPVLDTDTLLLPSELEQTGILWAELDVDGEPVNAFAIWLGLEPEERERQLDTALQFLEAHPGPAVFGGDFNSTPDSPVYARIDAAGFEDPFVALGLGSPPTDPSLNPTKRIDFVWLRDLLPLDAQVLGSTASDHRLVVVEASLPGAWTHREKE
jgi:endonuclease/exonuclease/phosphatase family metal-dependent hydrolase